MSAYIVDLLIEERDRLVAAIAALQGSAPAKRRGRPPAKKPADVHHDPTMPDWVKPKAPAKKKRKLSAAGRAAISAAAKKRWKLIKAGKAKPPFAGKKKA
jgi:hypothetical protein